MIDFKSTLKISINSLKVNKMRSALTSLGIIIGVSAVIIMLAVGNGAKVNVEKNIELMGSNLLTVRSASAKSGGVHMGMGSRPTLTLKDAQAIKKNVTGIDAVASASSESKQLSYGNQNWSTTVYGIEPEYLYVKNYEIDYGRRFNRDEVEGGAKVALLGSTVVTELFGDVDPIDKTIRVSGTPFRIIGVLKEKGSMGPMDQDDLIFIPILTAQKKVFGTDFPGMVKMIIVKCSNADIVPTTEKEITELLVARHRIGKNQENDFEIRNSAEFQERIKSTAATFGILLFSIALVSLIVGGIGIMNIMLVSVTERTKEIGIRMAIGARASDIRWQFLIESLLLSVIGGIIGVIVGIVGAKSVQLFSNELTISISMFSVILSLGFSGLVGVIFGYYPAHKASLLKPIDALRYE